MTGFKLHSSATIAERLEGVIAGTSAKDFEALVQYSSEVRRTVLEVTQPLHGSKRVVNTDNFYSSVTLLMTLKHKGSLTQSMGNIDATHATYGQRLEKLTIIYRKEEENGEAVLFVGWSGWKRVLCASG